MDPALSFINPLKFLILLKAYDSFSPKDRAYLNIFHSSHEPESVAEASNRSYWRDAIQEKINAQEKIKILSLIACRERRHWLQVDLQVISQQLPGQKNMGDFILFPDTPIFVLGKSFPRSATQVYPGVPFTCYDILSDEIIIKDERVDECNHEIIPPLNVPFSLQKSLESSVGALEFAKQFFVRGVTKDLFPVSYHILRSLVSSISIVLVMRAIISKNFLLSYRLWKARYRVYTRSTASLYDDGPKGVQKIVAVAAGSPERGKWRETALATSLTGFIGGSKLQ
ncbi:hypothetical protein CQW23_16609 [Capsicum baccatum]|uniref:Uncharacterized protein n=1 Tax=Capsicum baccatum TaxID=33114 RepID=A0A2G2WBF7_CAPBA|nr:hypothetical protein CQW23_16609 [Capsicum baccatum]